MRPGSTPCVIANVASSSHCGVSHAIAFAGPPRGIPIQRSAAPRGLVVAERVVDAALPAQRQPVRGVDAGGAAPLIAEVRDARAALSDLGRAELCDLPSPEQRARCLP